jgi:hypothetical protein
MRSRTADYILPLPSDTTTDDVPDPSSPNSTTLSSCPQDPKAPRPLESMVVEWPRSGSRQAVALVTAFAPPQRHLTTSIIQVRMRSHCSTRVGAKL